MSKTFSFEIKKRDKKSRARLGVVHTPHGDIQTPIYMPVGTQACVKAMTSREMHEIGTQILLSTTLCSFLTLPVWLAVGSKFVIPLM